ncbi:MAG: phosphate acyltransferase PlsX [bacterium]
MVRIAVDAMGGDYAPLEIVKGAIDAARIYGVGLLLVGREDEIQSELKKYDITGLDIKIKHASEVIEMGESPGVAIRKKKDASIVKTVEAVAQGEADALVAAGSTGAAMASSLFGFGRLPGIERPAITATIPAMGKPLVLVDAGANSESTPEMLYQFATMGKVFSEVIMGVPNPRIGVLNIGEEEGKGNELAKETYKLLSRNNDRLNFVGNVEGKELFNGTADVVVCDGFVGNVTLKVIEGVSSMILQLIKREFKNSLLMRLGALVALPALKRLKEKTNYEEFGGALLLGVKGLTIIAHGRSKAFAIQNAVRVAKEAAEADINNKILALYEKNEL